MMKTATKPAFPRSEIASPEGLKKAFDDRVELMIALSALQRDKHSLELDITEGVITLGYVDCLSVNWSRLRHAIQH